MILSPAALRTDLDLTLTFSCQEYDLLAALRKADIRQMRHNQARGERLAGMGLVEAVHAGRCPMWRITAAGRWVVEELERTYHE